SGMKARRFTTAGLEAFQSYVLSAREAARARGDVPPVPDHLLADSQYGEETAYELPSAEPRFATKFDIGEFLTGIIPGSDYEAVRVDGPLWTWLSARYFDQLTAGRSKIKEPRAYIAGITFQEFY